MRHGCGRRGLLALAIAGALAPAGVQGLRAQSAATLNLHAVEDPGMPVPGLGLTVGEVRGRDLHGDTGAVLGRVEGVLATRGRRIVALEVAAGGGILGLGDRAVVLMLDQVRRQEGRLLTPLDEARLRAQPPARD